MKSVIEVQGLRKEFTAYLSRPGLKGAFRDLLNRNYKIVPAVNDVSFTVKQGEMVDISVRTVPVNQRQLKCLREF